MEKYIRKKLTDVGNSKGILFTQDLLRQYGIETEVILEPRKDGVLIRAYKPTFHDRVNELRMDKEGIYKRMKQQANDQETQNYYLNSANTPFVDIDNEIL